MHIALIGCGEVGRCLASAVSRIAGVELTLCEKFQTPATRTFIQSQQATSHDSLGSWLESCDAIFSCVVGDCALEVAEDALQWLTPGTAYLDVTTAPPQAMRTADSLFTRHGSHFVDVAIMGAIATNGIATPMMVAGTDSAQKVKEALQVLETAGAQVQQLETSQAGDAATLKLLRSVFTKGMEALAVECLVSAEHFGVRDRLYEVLGDIDRTPLKDFLNMLVTTHLLHAKRRWHEVNNAIAQLEAAELPPRVMFGVREVFECTAQANWKHQNQETASISVEDALMALKSITQHDRSHPTT